MCGCLTWLLLVCGQVQCGRSAAWLAASRVSGLGLPALWGGMTDVVTPRSTARFLPRPDVPFRRGCLWVGEGSGCVNG